MVYDSRREVCVLFGGDQSLFDFSDLWEWDGVSWRKVPTINEPGQRHDAALAYDSDRGVIVLAGGRRSSPVTNYTDTWEYRPCVPDCERDCDLDVFDYLCFLDRFVNQSKYCDFERDGDLDIFDFLAFQNEFVEGCG